MISKSDNSSYEKFIFFLYYLIESLIQTKEKGRGRESFGKR